MMLMKCAAAAVSASLLVGTGYLAHSYRSLDSGLHRVQLESLGQAPRNRVASSGNLGTSQNILVVGIDSRVGLTSAEERALKVGSAASTSTDTIMVIHVPSDGSRAMLISIPRDTYVAIPDGWAKNKINAAFADASQGQDTPAAEQAGENLLIKTVSDLTGLTIDHYIQVGFSGFESIAKAIGGIDVNLCDSVDDTVAYNLAHGQGRAGSGFKMTAGRHHLNAIESLEFVRQRHNLPGIGDDLGREERQRYFIAQAFRRALSIGVLSSPGRLSSLIKAVKNSLVVDSGFTLQSLADQMIGLESNNIVGQTIPTTGSAMVHIANDSFASSVLTVDPKMVRAWIQRQLYPVGGVHHTASVGDRSNNGSDSRPASSPSPGGLVNPARGCIH